MSGYLMNRASLLARDRNSRTVSFLALENAEKYPAGTLIVLLCLVAATEGLDGVLFPASAKALSKYEGLSLDAQTNLSLVQALFQAVAGVIWGLLASRAIISRRTILTIGCFFQGLATFLMWLVIQNYPAMIFLRAVNGFMLSALRPIAFSIIGDRFDSDERGKCFGYVQSSMLFGSAIFGFLATDLSQRVIVEGFYGWKISFFIVGVVTMLLAPAIWLWLKEPPVKPPSKTANEESELTKLCRLFGKWTFAGLVFQGMFGLFPWRAFEFRTYFFQMNGLADYQAGLVDASGKFTGTIGSTLGGLISDGLTKWSMVHGRILTAEISVYGGIPFAYFTFMYEPSPTWAFMHYLILVAGLGLVATWPSAGCNSPVLVTLASESERSLIIAWQTSLEGAIGAFGPPAFNWLLKVAMDSNNVDLRCLESPVPEGLVCDEKAVGKAAGVALFYTSCVPWVFCGMLYTTLHCSYGRDLEAVAAQREREQVAMQGEVQLL